MLDAEAGDLPKRFYIHSKRDAEDPEKVRLPTIDFSVDPFDLDALETGELSGPNNGNGNNTQCPRNDNPIVVETVTEDDDAEDNNSGAHTPLDDVPLDQAPKTEPENDNEDIGVHLHPKH